MRSTNAQPGCKRDESQKVEINAAENEHNVTKRSKSSPEREDDANRKYHKYSADK